MSEYEREVWGSSPRPYFLLQFFLVFYLCFSLTSQTQTQNLKSLFQNRFPNPNPKSNIKSDSKEIFKAFVSKHTNLQISSNKLISLSELIQTT